MKKIRSFICAECKEHFERMVTDDITIVMCECKGLANRTITAPKFLGNSTGGNASFKQKRV